MDNILYVAFKGTNNSSYQLVKQMNIAAFYITNSFAGVRRDIDTLMSIRLEMLHIVNELPDDYSFTDELMECSRQYFLEGSQTTVIALTADKAVACASISYIDIMPTFSHPTGKRAHLTNAWF